MFVPDPRPSAFPDSCPGHLRMNNSAKIQWKKVVDDTDEVVAATVALFKGFSRGMPSVSASVPSVQDDARTTQLARDLETAQAQITDLKRRLESSEDAQKVATIAFTKTRREIEALASRNKFLEAELSKAQASAPTLELEALRSKSVELEQIVSSLQARLEEAQSATSRSCEEAKQAGERAASELAELQQKLSAMVSVDELNRERGEKAEREGKATEMCKRLQAQSSKRKEERDTAVAQRDALLTERDALVKECDGLVKERDGAAAERDGLVKERDGLAKERDGLAKERDSQAAEHRALVKERDAVVRDRDALQARVGSGGDAALTSSLTSADASGGGAGGAEREALLVKERDGLVKERDALFKERDSLLARAAAQAEAAAAAPAPQPALTSSADGLTLQTTTQATTDSLHAALQVTASLHALHPAPRRPAPYTSTPCTTMPCTLHLHTPCSTGKL